MVGVNINANQNTFALVGIDIDATELSVLEPDSHLTYITSLKKLRVRVLNNNLTWSFYEKFQRVNK